MTTAYRHEQLAYFRSLLPYLAASVLLLGAGIICGVITAVFNPTIADQAGRSLTEFMKTFRGLVKPFLALVIFINNALKTLLVIITGPLGGVVAVIFLAFNGFAIGIVLSHSIQLKGLLVSLLAIAPHGVVELPAVLLSTSSGLLLGALSVEKLFRKAGPRIGAELGRALRFYLAVIVPLLLLAAFIEAFVTPAVVQLR